MIHDLAECTAAPVNYATAAWWYWLHPVVQGDIVANKQSIILRKHYT